MTLCESQLSFDDSACDDHDDDHDVRCFHNDRKDHGTAIVMFNIRIVIFNSKLKWTDAYLSISQKHACMCFKVDSTFASGRGKQRFGHVMGSGAGAC